MSQNQALVSIQEKKIDFHGDEIVAVLVEINGSRQVYIPVRPLCDSLGLDWSAQLQRLKRDTVLAEVMSSVVITPTLVVEQGYKQHYTVVCLPLDFINGWLFGVSAHRVKPELRSKITQYQRECYRILAQAFQAEDSTATAMEMQASSHSLAVLEQIRDIGLAIAHMAEQQIAMEQRLNSRLDRAAVVVSEIQRRLSTVEQRLSPPQYVTDEMATDIMLAVKALAEQLSRREGDKNHYQAVYTEIYRRFRASSYTHIRADRYEEVMTFLVNWQKSLGEQE